MTSTSLPLPLSSRARERTSEGQGRQRARHTHDSTVYYGTAVRGSARASPVPAAIRITPTALGPTWAPGLTALVLLGAVVSMDAHTLANAACSMSFKLSMGQPALH